MGARLRTGTTALFAAALALDVGAAAVGQAKDAAPVTPEALSAHVKILASDDFQGRKPGTVGEEKTIAYIQDQFKKIGLKPAAGAKGYLQDVPMTEVTSKADGPMVFTATGKDGQAKSLSYEYFSQMIVWNRQRTTHAEVKDSDLVFVGYGITAPEFGWDDYAGVDVKGKTVVILVNDPGFATGDPALFGGGAMTWYGRWPYKYEEAARHGAAAAIIVHETRAAGYPWGVVANSNSVPKLTLMPADGGLQSRSAVEGWVQLDVAKELFAAAGLDYGTLKDSAARRGFKAVPMNAKMSVGITPVVRDVVSHNVVGIVPGAKRPDEVVLVGAHWDHLGVGPAVNGDTIYNGALDNATGVAGLIEMAKRYTHGPKPDRTLMFIAYTAEEQGLLGSEYYAQHPLYPVGKTVAGFNMDGLGVLGPVHDVVLVGGKKSDLEERLKAWTDAHGMVVNPEPFPERGYYYRSDHFNLAKVGIPVIDAGMGIDSVEHGAEWGKAKEEEYTRLHYHQPSDEWSPAMDLRGGAVQVNMWYDISRDLASSDAWPKWYDKAEFKAARDKSQGK
ncbi:MULTISPECIES: M28 family peptidase [Nitrospirillum]|uniref:Zn-dependent M28 family amino/carboxypeptidase n=1 Tax=Nitrospirillum amazonense TaxID=28077 RepID=A0A560G014_9PROT|nr:M28 family peptidase [Nitrospirillum amazonense]MEC4594910.1 M28 family peptidase [Nitrospirillum amazonense]TWB27141.1 Zn-dependent M28 family amino/carboxypeptidase [Nitrospirillum amazonense]